MTWAIRIVQKPSSTPMLRNRASSEAAMTISGMAIGRKINELTAPRARNR